VSIISWVIIIQKYKDMAHRKIITSFFLVILILSAIVYVFSQYLSGKKALEKIGTKFSEEPADNRDTAIVSVTEELLKQADKRNWKGVVENDGIKTEVGMDMEVSTINDKIVIGLINKFNFIAPEEEVEKIMTRIMSLFKSDEIELLVKGGKQALRERFMEKAMLPEFELYCELKWEKTNVKVNINCKLTDQKTYTSVSAVSSFFHPEYLISYKTYLKDFKNSKERSLLIKNYSFWTGVGALSFIVILNTIFYVRRANIKRKMPFEIERIQEFIKTGQFIAADVLINNTLKYLQNDPVFCELRGRLDIAIGKVANLKGKERFKSIKKAEEAFILIGKVKSLLANGRYKDALIHFEQIKSMSVYNPELKMLSTGMEKEREILEKESELIKKIEPIREMIERRMFRSAEKLATKFKTEYSSSRLLEELLLEIKSKIEEVENLKNEGKRLISTGKIDEGLKMLSTAQERDAESKDIKDLLTYIICTIGGKSLTLRLISSERVTIGRENCDININDLKVSRKHIRIEVSKNAIIRDENSRNGTFIDGRKITEEELKDGSNLNIGGAIEFTVNIFKENNDVASIVLAGKKDGYAIIKRYLPCSGNFEKHLEIIKSGKSKIEYKDGFFIYYDGMKYSIISGKHLI